MIEALVRDALSGACPGVHPAVRVVRDEHWLRVEPARPGPPQGWKLHVSSTVPDAEAVLRAALPVLVRGPTRFKVSASLDQLRRLNANDAPLEQVGKFITVYPGCDRECLDLAGALDTATAGLRGPAIATDRPVRPGSLVHYRFGGFRPRFLRTPLGQVVPAVAAPDGAVVPDLRSTHQHAPGWAPDPFLADLLQPSRGDDLLDGRYRPVRVLQSSPRGSVLLVDDVVTGGRQILKSARRDALARDDGSDARDRLAAEAATLESVAGLRDPAGGRIAPRLVGRFREDDDDYLVVEHVPGRTLHAVISELTSRGLLPSVTDVLRWGSAAAATAAALHGSGVVHRDLTARNLIEEPDGTLRLVDFELAWCAGSSRPPFGRGSPGSMSPQQSAGGPAAVVDDVYALGALLYFATTGVDPARAPRPGDLLAQRPAPAVVGTARARVAQVVERALAPDPEARFQSAGALRRALEVTARTAPTARAATAAPTGPGDDDFAAAARCCARLLRRQVRAGPDPRVELDTPLGIDTGLAGTVLALCAAVGAWDDPQDLAALAEAAEVLVDADLRQQDEVAGASSPGLYVGEAGIGLALMSAGLLLDDDRLLTAAERRAEALPDRPYASPDVFAGTAGRARFHLWMWRVTGSAVQRRAAHAAGSVLVESSEGGVWSGPASHGHRPGRPFLGYARGAAGVADVLLDLYEATGDDRFFETARDTARVLTAAAVRPKPSERTAGAGVQWPVAGAGEFFGPYWCHGAAGIGQFLLHAGPHDAVRADELVRASAEAVARARWAGPGQCHGLAGNIELLLDVHERVAGARHLAQARELGSLLLPFLPDSDADTNQGGLPDGYMFGLAGVLVALVRLAAPGQRPRQLAGEGPCALEWLRRP